MRELNHEEAAVVSGGIAPAIIAGAAAAGKIGSAMSITAFFMTR
jgi:lactobin A/cerein 7B family class IIb bacteriocin